MGVETRIPDESAPGAEYPNYNELGSEWKGQDRVFVHKALFDKMATGSFCLKGLIYHKCDQNKLKFARAVE